MDNVHIVFRYKYQTLTNNIKGPWAWIGPLSFCFIEVMHNECLTFEKLHAEIFGQHLNTTNQ